jgi:CelD/BcsL family acetyltransferase involved in cellulose biosynthesis
MMQDKGGCFHSLSGVSVRAVRSWAELAEIAGDWNRLAAESALPSVFLTWEWVTNWWSVYGGNNSLLLLACQSPNGSLCGVAPMYRAAWPPGRFAPLRILRVVGAGSGDSFALDWMVSPEKQLTAVRAVLDWLWHHSSEWDVIELASVPAESGVGRIIRQEMCSRGAVEEVSRWPHLAVSLPVRWEEYQSRLSPKMREGVTYMARRLQREFCVSLRRYHSEQDVRTFVDRLADLQMKRFRQRGQTAMLESEESRSFLSAAGAALARRGWADCWALELSGATVAAHFGLRYAGRHCYLQGGFDPAYAGYSVGTVLLAHVMQHLIRDGVTVFDFLAGEEPYKIRWGAEASEYYGLRWARPGGAGAAYIGTRAAWRRVKQTVRTVVPEGVWRGGREVYRWFCPVRGTSYENR